jgi:hypothetical protein
MRDLLRCILRTVRVWLMLRRYERMMAAQPDEFDERLLQALYAATYEPDLPSDEAVAEANRMQFLSRLTQEGDN